MIQSMTGYGRAEYIYADHKTIVEIRSLNSKQLDMTLKISPFFRLREQWLAWYLCAALESIINILSGQYVLLILKLGYFTNTTYGYIKWSRYIREHRNDDKTMF